MSNYWATREVMTFDVDKFIADVHKKYEQMAQENPALAAWAKTEEELQQLWDDVLNDHRPGGDASLYPNQHGPQPALMEVWHKAGDFWRAKYRLGDKLLCDQNGAALNSMELGLIAKAKADSVRGQVPDMDDSVTETTDFTSTSIHTNSDPKTMPAAAGENANTETNIITDRRGAVREDSAPVLESNDAPAVRGQVPDMGADDIEAMGNQATPVRGLSPDIEAATGNNASVSYHSGAEPDPLPYVTPKPKRQRRAKKAAEQPKPQQLSLFDEELMAEQQEESVEKKLLRSVGYLAAAAAAIVFVWQTGLIIPLGLIGLGASGLLK